MQTILFSSILFALLSALFKIQTLSRALRLFSSFIALSLLSELTAFYMSVQYKNNMPVFHIFSPVLFALLCLYFTKISPTIHKYKLGYISLVACIVISALNTAFFQPISTMNSNYLLLEGLFGCGMALIALYDFLRDDNKPFIHRNVHFWITLTMLFHYLGTYIVYLLIMFLKHIGSDHSDLIRAYILLWLLAVTSYIAIGLLFLLVHSKKIENG